uniref:RCC1-like domain-containing protein n=1 Tax=Plectus sambesii TaxID=2011161 RepID=A0A914W0V0_9BILA
MSGCESAHERFQEIVGTVPECRFLGFVPIRYGSSDGKSSLPQCLLVSENGLLRLSPQCGPLDLFIRCLTPKLDLTTAESLCSSLCVSFETMCAQAAKFVLESLQGMSDASFSPEVALRLCELGKISTIEMADLFESHSQGGFILPTLVSRSKSDKLSDDDGVELASRIVRIFVEDVGRLPPGFERNRRESDFRHFLLSNQHYLPERCLELAVEAGLWSSVSVLLRLHDLARRAAVALLQLPTWPVDDSFVRAVAFRNFAHLLISDTRLAAEYFARVANFSVQLTEKSHLALLGALASPTRVEMSRILDDNRPEDANLIHQASRAYFTCAIRCAFDATATEDGRSEDRHRARRTLACGANHSVMVAQDGVYCWGKFQTKKRIFSVSQRAQPAGSSGNEGVSTEPAMEQFSLPLRLSLPVATKVVSVAAGAESLLLLTADGTVLGMGSNRLGQLGVGHRDSTTAPTPLGGFDSDDCVTAIVCGQYHCAAMTSSGRVYTWGWGVHGQLAVADRIHLDDALVPTLVNSISEAVVAVACGYAHTSFLTASGQLLVCGNDSYGQLGLGGGGKRVLPVAIDPQSFGGEQVRLVATGLFHSVAVTAAGRVFTWGATPQALKFKALLQKRKNAAAAAAATAATAAVDKQPEAPASNVVVVEGTHLRPVEVHLTGGLETRRDKIVQVECGFYHSALITNSGHLYTWGKSLEFQLGHGDKKERQSPALITNVPDACQWRSVSCDESADSDAHERCSYRFFGTHTDIRFLKVSRV